MKRKFLALLLCAALLLTLCGLHLCTGTHCAVCAQLHETRRVAVALILSLLLCACASVLRVLHIGTRRFLPVFTLSPIELKVRLTD